MDNSFDNSVMLFINQFAQRSHFADLFINHLMWNNMLKGGVIMALFYWVWFMDGSLNFSIRAKLTSTLLFSVLATALARGMAIGLPYRSRPVQAAALKFKLPFGMNKEAVEHWSSFPSDHAALFFAIAAGLFLVNRRIGALALVHTFVVICLPRIYVGVHYPTDVLVGAMIGIGMAYLANRPVVVQRVSRPATEWRERHIGSFYAAFYLLTYQIADLFNGCRAVLSAAAKAFGKNA